MTPYIAIAVIVGLLIAGLFYAGKVRAEPLYKAQNADTVITLTDEPCQLDAVTNLPNRATWEEKGKTFEGCWGGHPAGVVVSYWSDKTVALIPLQALVKISGV